MHKKTPTKLLVFGGGRMGLSHAAMATLLDDKASVFLIEPSFVWRWLLKMIVGRKIFVKKSAAVIDIKSATHAIICTPPHIHQKNYDQLARNGFKGNLLIEKPIMTRLSNQAVSHQVTSGYVLTHSFWWRELLLKLESVPIKRIKVQLQTNQDFTQDGTNWRTSGEAKGLSLLREFGSHCINLILNLDSDADLEIIHSSDNEVRAKSKNVTPIELDLLASSAAVRKSVYTVEVETEEMIYHTDFYGFSEVVKHTSEKTVHSLAGEGVHANAYLRGQDFSVQMETFLDPELEQLNSFELAEKTDKVLLQLESELRT